MKFQRISMSLILAVMISGCATLSQEQCKQGDWQGVGYSDGASGYMVSRIQEHQKACAEYGVTPNLNEYQRGWEKGIAQYCVPSNGYQVGRQGKSYYGVCTGPDSEAFVRNYQIGQREYKVEERLREIEKKIEEIDKKLSKSDITRQERETLRYQRGDLQSERNILNIESSGFRRW
ncbi:MAG TPA: DNA repair protein [Desulfobacteraceae bacterium]|nr:DNA repair protein [Desulfobacteraceae bacterium]